jgi:hypothetical protein
MPVFAGMSESRTFLPALRAATGEKVTRRIAAGDGHDGRGNTKISRGTKKRCKSPHPCGKLPHHTIRPIFKHFIENKKSRNNLNRLTPVQTASVLTGLMHFSLSFYFALSRARNFLHPRPQRVSAEIIP